MKRIEPILLYYKPQMVLVVCDVNSTIAAALTAAKLGVGVAHIEAGLRSFDMTMPEEINRKLTDAISNLLFVTEQNGVDNLKHEGVSAKKIFFVGNVMIDCLLRHRELAAPIPPSRPAWYASEWVWLPPLLRSHPAPAIQCRRPRNTPRYSQGGERCRGRVSDLFPHSSSDSEE